jgi:hypothetical protein
MLLWVKFSHGANRVKEHRGKDCTDDDKNIEQRKRNDEGRRKETVNPLLTARLTINHKQ